MCSVFTLGVITTEHAERKKLVCGTRLLLTPMAGFYIAFKSHTIRGKQASANRSPEDVLQKD